MDSKDPSFMSPSAEAVFAEYVDRLLAGEMVDVDRIRRDHPAIASELIEQLRSFNELTEDDGDNSTPRQLGDFEILGEIGRGGMGIVYEATQLSLGRRVALKVLPSIGTLDLRQVRRFRNEAQAAARLHHTNIVPIHAVGCTRGVNYFAMQYVDGRNLGDVIRELRGEQPMSSAATNLLSTHHGNLTTAPATRSDAPVQDAKSNDGSNHPPPLSTSRSAREDYYRIVARLGIQAAEALAHAHESGIVHRDIKPTNLLIDENGKLWVTDFGLAKVHDSPELTATGDIVGTAQYMSPEQIQQPAKMDGRTDIYSLGATLYELLSLQPLFPRASREQLIERVVREEPRRLRNIDRWIPRDLEAVIFKALEKPAHQRYQSAQLMADDLRRFLDNRPTNARPAGRAKQLYKWVSRNKLKSSLLASLMLVAALIFAILIQQRNNRLHEQKVTRIHNEVVPAIRQHIGAEDFFAAHLLLKNALIDLPTDPLLLNLEQETLTSVSFRCDVPGVELSIRRYGTKGDWHVLGTSPFESVEMPIGVYRWKAEKPGYVTKEFLKEGGGLISLDMFQPGEYPLGMIPIDAQPNTPKRLAWKHGITWTPPWDVKKEEKGAHGNRSLNVQIPHFLIDQFEVSNEEYQEFVDQRGYERPEFWREAFQDGESKIGFLEAMKRFVDATGTPGPSTWQNGKYPTGEANFPVAGVSWYEASAYARFRGKHLPTIYHWRSVAGIDLAAVNLALSNFGGVGVAERGHYSAVTVLGLYDMAGNVREWCHNKRRSSEHRYSLGGGWSDPSYMFEITSSGSPWDRSPEMGFRCVSYPHGVESLDPILTAPVDAEYPVDHTKRVPVSADVIDGFRQGTYFYEKLDLNTRSESTKYEFGIREEVVSIDAAYDRQRIKLAFRIPNGVEPPYQVIIWHIGEHGLVIRSVEADVRSKYFKYLVESGRVLLVPELFGYYGRPSSTKSARILRHQETVAKRAKELMRTIDYLETRPDLFDLQRVALMGSGTGACDGPIFLAVEDRLRMGILIRGGLQREEFMPSCDPFNFAPQVRVPVLMVNGKNDITFPFRESQQPLFDLLGTVPEQHKLHATFPGGNGMWLYAARQHRRVILKWLDERFGVPRRVGSD